MCALTCISSHLHFSLLLIPHQASTLSQLFLNFLFTLGDLVTANQILACDSCCTLFKTTESQILFRRAISHWQFEERTNIRITFLRPWLKHDETAISSSTIAFCLATWKFQDPSAISLAVPTTPYMARVHALYHLHLAQNYKTCMRKGNADRPFGRWSPVSKITSAA